MTGLRRPRLILASASPRRHELLAGAGFAFEVVRPEVEEIFSPKLTLREATSWNALRKGLAVARAHPEAVVLAADTLVALEHEVIGKPTTLEEAKRILRRLRGRSHDVVSSVFIAQLRAGRSESFSVHSWVTFKKLSDEMIERYLARIDPLDKAGAYAAQGEGRAIIARVVGSRTNVIGLPMEKTRAALARFHLRPSPRTPSA
jgi:septum formation protein